MVDEFTWFTDTPAPIPTWAVLPTAVPSDAALASVCPLAFIASAPLVETVRPSPSEAVACALTTLTGDGLVYNRPNPVHGALVAAGRARHKMLLGLIRDRLAEFA